MLPLTGLGQALTGAESELIKLRQLSGGQIAPHGPRWSAPSALAAPPVCASALLLTYSLTILPSCPLPRSSTHT